MLAVFSFISFYVCSVLFSVHQHEITELDIFIFSYRAFSWFSSVFVSLLVISLNNHHCLGIVYALHFRAIGNYKVKSHKIVSTEEREGENMCAAKATKRVYELVDGMAFRLNCKLVTAVHKLYNWQFHNNGMFHYNHYTYTSCWAALHCITNENAHHFAKVIS